MLATRPDTDTIAITRTFDGIEEAAHRVIEQIGGMESVMQGAKMAVLKPNFVAGGNGSTGSTTSFALMKAVAEEVRACGAEPVLCETPGTEFDRDATYTILGIDKFCEENGIRIIRVDPEGGEQDWVELQPEGARRLRRFRVPRILKEARLINLPVLKTHVVSTMTLGIKPDLTIVDGSIGQDGEGPVYGDKADLQVLVAGRDSLAVDLVCCQVVGVKPRDIPHIKLALEQLGKPTWTLAGEDVGVIKKFRLPHEKSLYRFVFWLMYPLDYPYT